MSFRTWQSGPDTHVLPDDVARLVPRVLDPALFDVTALARAGLDDAGSDRVPLLVQTADAATPPVLEGGPLLPTRKLDSIRSTAATLHKVPSSTRAAWTFVTQPGPSGRQVVPPVLVADVRTALDEHNLAAAGRPLDVEVDPHHLRGATPVPVIDVRLWASADDGRTWTALPLHRGPRGAYHAAVPAALLTAGGSVGVRVSARDALGDTVEQTVLRAIAVAP